MDDHLESVGVYLTSLPSLDIRYKTEAELREGLCDLADISGWKVFQEFNVPGYGRIDILLISPKNIDCLYIIEIKLELLSISSIKRAFQQIDGYGRWFKAHYSNQIELILASPVQDINIIESIAVLYPTITYMSINKLIHWLLSDRYCAERVLKISMHRDYLVRRLALYDHVLMPFEDLLVRMRTD